MYASIWRKTMSDRISIVLAHGQLASGLVSAVDQITGMGDRFVAMSNTGLSGAELEQKLRVLVEETGAKVVFTDLPAGSCNIAAFRLLRDRDVIVVSGVNLPTLLHFVTHPQMTPEAAATEAVERGAPTLKVTLGTARGN
jgi:PTS system N-acetylgalactosamine-specific IIA component